MIYFTKPLLYVIKPLFYAIVILLFCIAVFIILAVTVFKDKIFSRKKAELPAAYYQLTSWDSD